MWKMTSVDSGVDTGNDSNDSYATLESQSTTHEVTNTRYESTNCLAKVKQMNPVNEGTQSLLHDRKLQDKVLSLQLDCSTSVTIHNSWSIRFHNEFIGHPKSPVLRRRALDSPLRRARRSSTYFSPYIRLAESILRRAVSFNNVDEVATLLARGANPNSADRMHRSVLHLAACRGYCDIVRLLLEGGANPNMKDALGNTPLHLAACTSNVAVVTLLLKAGTHVDSTDQFGRSPLQLAQSKLALLQKGLGETADSQKIKAEAKQVVEMMLTYLDRCGKNSETELLRAFSSQLTLSHTQEEIERGMNNLLASLESFSLEKPVSDKKTLY